MAPERFLEGTDPIPQSDIWALGATLFEILTGKVPFGEEGGKTQIETDAALPSVAGVSSDIQRLIHACLDKQPGNRPSAEQLIDAAMARQYPIRKKTWLYAAVVAAVLSVLGCVAFFFLSQPTVQPAVLISQEDVYKTALAQIEDGDADSLQVGVTTMDSLSNTNYIPAIYQMAFIYGWYSDSASVKRKEMLGIKMDENFLPVSDRYSNKAVALFTRIMELNDTSYADINANAIYRLACYYVMPNNIYKPNYEKGKRFLLRSREWALLAGDRELLEKIDKGLASFQE
jgi:serine/threonine protein kinase